MHFHIRMENRRVVTTPNGEQNGHYGHRMANRRDVTTPNGEQNGHYGRRMENKKAVTPRMTNKRNTSQFPKDTYFPNRRYTDLAK